MGVARRGVWRGGERDPMTTPARNANGGLLAYDPAALQPGPAAHQPLGASASIAGSGPPVRSGSPLPDDRLEWTPADLATQLGCRAQKITYHCRQLERRGRLGKTDGVWRFDHAMACLLLQHVMDNGHRSRNE